MQENKGDKTQNIEDQELDQEISQTNGGQEDLQPNTESQVETETETQEMDKASEEAKEKEEEPIEIVEIPKTRLEELEKAEAVSLEEVKRERASASNYRKRLEKQRDEFAEIASARILSKLLDISDDVKRVIDNGVEAIPKDHLEGISLLQQRIQTVFDAEDVTLLKIAEGKTHYDPMKHEAIMTQTNEDLPNNTIITQVATGFVKGERILRPAKVIISKQPVKPKPEETKDGETNAISETEAKSEAEVKSKSGDKSEKTNEQTEPNTSGEKN